MVDSNNIIVEIGQIWYGLNIKRYGIVEEFNPDGLTCVVLREPNGKTMNMGLNPDNKIHWKDTWIYVSDEKICEICNQYDCKQGCMEVLNLI